MHDTNLKCIIMIHFYKQLRIAKQRSTKIGISSSSNDSRGATGFWGECNTGGYISNSSETALFSAGTTAVGIGLANVIFPEVAIPIKAAVTAAYGTGAVAGLVSTAKECHK